MIQWIGVAAIAIAALASASPAYAQAAAADSDAKELAAYRLAGDTLTRVIRINRAFVQQVMQHPKVEEARKVEAEMEALSRKDELSELEQKRMVELARRHQALEEAVENPLGGESKSLSEMATRIEKFPPLMEALQREGLTPREYAKFWLVYLQAAFAYGFQRSGMLKELPADVHPANVRFIGEHQAEIEAMQKEFEALGRPKQ